MSKAKYKSSIQAFLNIGTPVLTAPLTQSNPDAGPTIIQQEAVTVYNSVNKKVRALILGGDFNIRFDTDEGLRCVQFLKKELNLDFVSAAVADFILEVPAFALDGGELQ
ncbi:hypothetical protein PV325_011589 [Microctonus aethiopoides]|nr:hypothetical protein PV325_011589 [Microctonus aethiopoides]